MTKRVFEHYTTRDGAGKIASAMKIECSMCENTEEYINKTRTRMHPEGLVKIFRNKGWHVSPRAGKDLCPDCQERKPRMPPKTSEKAEIAKTLADLKAVMPTDTQPHAEPPRAMTRDDKRIVFAEIDAHYPDEDKGYDEDWTDKKIADKLGVPVAWVVEIREEFFGPVHDKKVELEALLKEIDAIGHRVTALNIEELRTQIKAVEKLFATAHSEASAATSDLIRLRQKVVKALETK